jgi:dihydroflavonol-4-reductase
MLPAAMTNQAGIQPGDRVCVTGAAGFIGSHVVCTLLERGYRVRGTVRDPNNTAATAHLVDHAKQLGAELELVAADLTKPGAFVTAVSDCPYVCHVASSVRLTAPDPQREIVDVAVDGTRNVLDAIIAAGCARRVVITSSISAIVDESKPADYIHRESDWNESASLRESPYPLSKKLAEQAAWTMVEQLPEDRRFALVTINPTMVLGPILSKEHARSSPSVVRDLMTGKFPMVPNFSFGIADVRDVALAHARALEDSRAEGRYIVDCRSAWFIELADEIHKAHPNLNVPRRRMPDALMYIAALFDKRLSFPFLRSNLSIARKHDNTRSRERLGMQYRSLEQTIRETAQSILDLGAM